MADINVDLNFDNHPTLLRMHRSTTYIRAVIGPAGSAKTTYAFKDLIVRSLLQQPAGEDNTRYTRWVVVRNTNKQLKRNTLESFKLAMGGLMNYTRVVESPNIMATWTMDLPDGTRVHSEFQFAAMDTEGSLGDALGAEMTGVLVDEASEIAEAVIEIISTRIGRYPSGVRGKASWTGMVMTTNGPKENHWLFTWSRVGKPEWAQIETKTERKYFELFEQPPALIRPREPGGEWLPNPEAENIHNLTDGYNYYFKMLGNKDDYIKAYVEGKFSALKNGKVVFPEFIKKRHVLDSRLIKIDPDGVPLYLAFDFGRTPVCLVAISTRTGRLVIIREICGENMAISTLFDSSVKPVLKQAYPKCRVVNAWGDPAGADKGQNVELSPFGVLAARGVEVQIPWDTRNRMDPRLEAVRRRLKTMDMDGEPMLQISTDCPLTIQAFEETYIYENVRGQDDVVRETPTKSHIGWVSDLMDGAQYLCLGFDTTYAGRAQQDERVKPKKRKHLIRRTA